MKYDQLPLTTPKGRVLTVENAVIKSVSLTIADHGVLSGWLQIKFKSGQCGFGGYILGKVNAYTAGSHDFAADFIIRSMQIMDVEKWEDIPGCPLRCLHEGLGGGIVAIGNFLGDDWFCPCEEWKDFS